MLMPRRLRANKSHQRGWYYIESDGLSVLAGGRDGFAKAVKITWRQIDLALKIRRLAGNGEDKHGAA